MQGDCEAFYLRHFKAIYRVCYAFMRNAADTEDCTEDTFVKARQAYPLQSQQICTM